MPGVCAVRAVMLGSESLLSRCAWSRRTREAQGRHREVGSEGSVERRCGARDTNRIRGVVQPGRAGTQPQSPPSTIGLCLINPASMHRRYDSLPREICGVSWIGLRAEESSLTAPQKSADGIGCAGQRVSLEGESPSDARTRGVISKSGGNASLAPTAGWGGQGVHREVESDGCAEKHRAVIDGSYPEDEPVGQRGDKVEPALWRRRRSRPLLVPRCVRTARCGRLTCDLRRTRGGPGWRRVSDPISRGEMGSEAPRVVGQLYSTRGAVTNRVTERSAVEWAGEGGWRRELEGDRPQEEEGAWRGTVP